MRFRLLLLALPLLLISACGAPDKPSVSLYLAIQRADIDQVERHLYWGTPIDQAFPSGRYPLHDAAAQGRVVLIRLLLKHGAEIGPRDSDGMTPLQLAVLEGRTQAAEVLFEAGAELDPSTLLLLAAQRDSKDRDVVRFLKGHGADMNATDGQGDSALLIATRHGNHRLVHHLVEQGAEVNLRNLAGQTALDLATAGQFREIRQFLLRYGGVSGQ